MSNRVEELERQVAQLQAAVNGLTEELVEMKERVRQLEDGAVAGEPSTRSREGERDTVDQPSAGPSQEHEEPKAQTTKSDDHVDVVERTDTDVEAGSASEQAAEADVDTHTTEEQADTTEDAESEGSDIIVA